MEWINSNLHDVVRVRKVENSDKHPFIILPYAVIAYYGFTYELVLAHTSSRQPETFYNHPQLISKYI